MDRSQPFTILARVVATLADRKPVTTPYAMGARNTEWSETFRVDVERVTREHAVLHEMRSRRDGVERHQSSDACFWSLSEMLDQIIDWDDEDFTAIEAMLVPHVAGTSITVDAIAALDQIKDDTDVRIPGTGQWTVKPGGRRPYLLIENGRDPKWTLDDSVMAVMREKSGN